MAEDYIHQHYEHAPGKPPTPRHVSEVFGAKLHERFAGREAEVLGHARYRLHVFTSRGRHLLQRQGRLRMPLGYAGAFADQHRQPQGHGRLAGAGGVLRRARAAAAAAARLPHPAGAADARRTCSASMLASCSIPFWLDAVHDIPGAPRGAYWDGGITDYHLHLDYAAMHDGPGAVPAFPAARVIPGWLDKA